MKITLVLIGKTDHDYLKDGIEIFTNRLKHYIPFEIKEVNVLRKISALPPEQLKIAEAELISPFLQKAGCVVLLDENGTQFTSVDFSGFLQKRMNAGVKELLFVVGGAWGFADSVYQRADFKVSLSKMTFSHQMVRLFFVEQLYRAFTILKGENYHNE